MVAGNSALDLFNSIMGKTLSMFLVQSWEKCHSLTNSRSRLRMKCVCLSVCRRIWPRTCQIVTTASQCFSAFTSSCASEQSQPRETFLRSTSQCLCVYKDVIYSAFTPSQPNIICVRACVCCRYWEAVLEMLWPRFELILEMNIQSIRNTDPQKLGVLDTRPHYVWTRTHHQTWNVEDSLLSWNILFSAWDFD